VASSPHGYPNLFNGPRVQEWSHVTVDAVHSGGDSWNRLVQYGVSIKPYMGEQPHSDIM
jgi:hypothetical protein